MSTLQAYLKVGAISYSVKREEDLVRLVKACVQLNLPEENEQLESTNLTSKFHHLGIEMNPLEMVSDYLVQI